MTTRKPRSRPGDITTYRVNHPVPWLGARPGDLLVHRAAAEPDEQPIVELIRPLDPSLHATVPWEEFELMSWTLGEEAWSADGGAGPEHVKVLSIRRGEEREP